MTNLENKVNTRNIKEALLGACAGAIYESMPSDLPPNIKYAALSSAVIGLGYSVGAPKLGLIKFPDTKEKIKGGFAVGFGFFIGRTLIALIKNYF